jgi:hypothetical protein
VGLSFYIKPADGFQLPAIMQRMKETGHVQQKQPPNSQIGRFRREKEAADPQDCALQG